MEYNDIPKFSPPELKMEGEKIKIDDILNEEVAFLDIVVRPSAFYESDYASIQIMKEDGTQFFFHTSSSVIIAQLKEQKDSGKLPLKSTVKKVKNYYTLS
jgi:hypothetical protein